MTIANSQLTKHIRNIVTQIFTQGYWIYWLSLRALCVAKAID
jgi:hypothetical protein